MHLSHWSTLLLAAAIAGPAGAQTLLSPGDIAVIAARGDDPDDFRFVPLVDLTAGTEITFTDSGWSSSTGTFRGGEGAVRYIASGPVPAGTNIGLGTHGGDFVVANDPIVGLNGFLLSTGGDQVLAFQGPSSSPSFVFAVQTNSTEWQLDATSSNDSALPPGLTDGLTAVAVGAGPGAGDEFDNAWYAGITTGSAADLLLSVASAGNWIGDDISFAPVTANFTLDGAVTLTPIVAIQLTTDPSGDSPLAGQTVTTQGVVTAVITEVDGDTFVFIQDGAGPWTGLALFRPDVTPALGDRVQVTGTVSEFFGLTEIAFGSLTVLSAGNAVPLAEPLASGEVTVEAWESVLVRVANVAVSNANPDAPNDFGEFEVDDGTGPVRVDDLSAALTFDPVGGEFLDFVQGPLYFSFANFKIAPRDDADIGTGGGPVVITPIYTIQGEGRSSPLVGQSVVTEGIVTGDVQDLVGTHGDLNGFYLQDPSGDGDPATSDGIFVFDGFAPGVDVQPGDRVQVQGTVQEFFGLTEINATVTGAGVVVVEPGVGGIAPVAVDLPVPDVVLNADGKPIADLENVEGMLVGFPQTLEVSELFNLDRFGELRLAEPARLYQFTNASLPDADGYAAHLEDIARRNIMLDDGLTVQNPIPIRYPAPGLTTANFVRMGDTVTALTGVVHFSRGSGGFGDETYRIMPTDAEPLFVNANARPPVPLPGGGRLTVASFNVLNFFNDLDDGTGSCFPSFTSLDCRGADSVEEYQRQLQKLVTALSALDADIVGLIEIENDYPEGEASAIDDLVDALNTTGTARCSGGYDYVVPPGAARVGDDAIAVGILYCTETVRLAPETDVVFLTDADLPDLGLDFGEPVFTGFATNRSPLAATFREVGSGETFTLVVNHFKSKGDSGLATLCTDPTVDPNCDQGDGQGYWNLRRTQAAIAIDTWLLTGPTGSADPDVLIVGDLNSYLQEDPIAVLANAGYVNLIAATDAYSFVFDAQAGVLDYALASPGLAQQVTGAAEWHINADEADALDYNLDFGRDPALFDGTVPYRASDHDPVLVGLDLATPAVEIQIQVRQRLDPTSPGTTQILFYADNEDVLATFDTACGPAEARPVSGGWRDFNADGFLDTVGRFVTAELGLTCADTTLTCTGTLRDGTPFVGTSNAFRTVGADCR